MSNNHRTIARLARRGSTVSLICSYLRGAAARSPTLLLTAVFVLVPRTRTLQISLFGHLLLQMPRLARVLNECEVQSMLVRVHFLRAIARKGTWSPVLHLFLTTPLSQPFPRKRTEHDFFAESQPIGTAPLTHRLHNMQVVCGRLIQPSSPPCQPMQQASHHAPHSGL